MFFVFLSQTIIFLYFILRFVFQNYLFQFYAENFAQNTRSLINTVVQTLDGNFHIKLLN